MSSFVYIPRHHKQIWNTSRMIGNRYNLSCISEECWEIVLLKCFTFHSDLVILFTQCQIVTLLRATWMTLPNYVTNNFWYASILAINAFVLSSNLFCLQKFTVLLHCFRQSCNMHAWRCHVTTFWDLYHVIISANASWNACYDILDLYHVSISENAFDSQAIPPT